ILSWNQVILYPAEARPDNVIVASSLRLPRGWKHASALAAKEPVGDAIQFEPVSLTTLVDSPVLAGAYVKRIGLTPPSRVPHYLNLAADSEAALAMPAAQIDSYRQLVVEANALFGAHHYNRYEFLYSLSDQIASFGLEHHESSDDRVGERTIVDDQLRKVSAD